jgi:hypothetical protein
MRTAAWPIEALPFEEILTPVVESFLDSEEDRAFDWSRSAIRQLYERVDELGASPHKEALLALIRDQLGEFDCLAICSSGQLIPGSTTSHSVEPPASNPPT